MFEYRPLDASQNEIRLITVLPRPEIKLQSRSDTSQSNSLSSSIVSSTLDDDRTSQSDFEEGAVDAIERRLSKAHIGHIPLVRCQLEHVSLNEFTPRYLGFINNSKEENWTTDLYLKWTKSLLDKLPDDVPDSFINKKAES